MLRRLRFSFLLSLALVASISFASVSRAQSDAGAPPADSTAPPSASPPAPSPPPRPPLVTSPPPASPQPSASAPTTPSPLRGINPGRDARDLAAQGGQAPSGGEVAGAHEVFSDDWWGKARPVIELHGYFRTRGSVFHNFFLGRHSSSVTQTGDQQYLWPIPLDQSYATTNNGAGGGQNVAVCGPNGTQNCYDKTESSANLRLRLNPEIHISDNLRIMTQLDLLDNLVLGSTPESYAMQPATGTNNASGAQKMYPTGYQPVQYNGGYAPVNYAPIGFLATTQGSPTAGVNGWTNAINVNRVWGEYMTPLGQIRFGRMPQQWGLGMVANSGDGIDSDYQSTIDRIMFISGIKSMDLYFGGAWDFVSTGPTNANPFDVYGGQPYNTCNLCNVNEWAAFIAHRTNPELQNAKLAHGDLVLNGGLYALYRWQYNDIQQANNNPNTIDYGDQATLNNGLEPRRAWAVTPDLWVQALWQKLRFEAEAVTIQGQIGYSNLSQNLNSPVAVRQYGLASQTEYRGIDDKLDLQFGFGWASGDPYANNGGSGALQPSSTGLQSEFTQNGQPAPISTFAFHPDYRVDLIFWREIMSRVEGAYYFRPSVDYDFLRNTDGEKFGGGAALIWSRASEFEQTPGHHRDLGVEMDLQLYYQSKDGSLNDDLSKIGGFYTMLQYGVFFPLGGLGYLPGQVTVSGFDASLSAAQTIRLFLGIVF
jgi:uncharacterized protein (TIGR04551 family)